MQIVQLPPLVILLAFILVIVVLLLIRRRLAARGGPVVRQQPPAVQIGNGQTIGAREEQDDYFATAETPAGTIAVLADGISGLANGRMASTTAVSTFIRQFMNVNSEREIAPFLSQAARQANGDILRQLSGSNGGTTAVAAIICGDALHWGAVGDSVIIIYRKGEFIPVNRKHILATVLEERCLSGEITADQARGNPMRKRLINYLGYESFESMDICEEPFRLKPKDKILLCSDGLYNGLTEIEMDEVLGKGMPPYEAAEQLIEAIERKRLKNQDNATIVILEPAL
ncbi:PP2C family protein-serine/threonine phosphatase [Paenibacillus radicis (ex Gao et al. 2016)]|uniref:Protein phosphatase n=1 Tax=Paenibacillus radicis (ex Gao et al. 2016) TaxID=1737354 RepID=A0A917HM11_9BACL|nr:protein phosphatase 2C domain-containing protein [Paenibacillus radicis (ex Gao et al. 2016)]GGG82813.1 protein phosphatase [Paenibacillus radicis (ex Gao et al. 2016)]